MTLSVIIPCYTDQLAIEAVVEAAPGVGRLGGNYADGHASTDERSS
jgi:hypothetical protein